MRLFDIAKQKPLKLSEALPGLQGKKIVLVGEQHKAAVDAGQIGGSDVQLGSEGYPETLEVLVEGVSQVGRADGHKLRFLRRIPVDPMTREANWGLRCYSDKPDASSWCGDNVFDVYSQSPGRALDGTYYKDW